MNYFSNIERFLETPFLWVQAHEDKLPVVCPILTLLMACSDGLRKSQYDWPVKCMRKTFYCVLRRSERALNVQQPDL